MNGRLTQPGEIRAYLLTAMRRGEYASCDCLPPEKDLAETLGISRTMLRDVLGALDREGFITRRHGVGTIINRHVLAVPCRMDIEVEFLDMIRESGFAAAVASAAVEDGVADEKIARALQIEPGDPILRVKKICTADKKPAIYCEDVVAKSLIRESYTEADCKRSIFEFLREKCGVLTYLDITDIRPLAADAALAELLQVREGTSILNMDEVDYTSGGKPVLYSSQYFADGFFRHTVLRKRL